MTLVVGTRLTDRLFYSLSHLLSSFDLPNFSKVQESMDSVESTVQVMRMG
jgi:hypothetical protein